MKLALALLVLLCSSCSGTSMERHVGSDGSVTVKFRTDGTWNAAPAWPLGEVEARPDIFFPPEAPAIATRASPRPGAGAAINLGDGVGMDFGQLQHSDIAQARGQTYRALADDALLAFAASLMAKTRIASLDNEVRSQKIRASIDRAELDARTEQSAIRANENIQLRRIGE